MSDIQPSSHPLKWEWLVDTVERSGMENPDVYIEDFREYGPAQPENVVVINGGNIEPDTHCVEASFSVICDIKNNRIVIRNHY